MSGRIYSRRWRERMAANSTKPKYAANRSGRFDCPERGCDRTGKNGFDNPHAVGAHRRHAHKAAPHSNGNGHALSLVSKTLPRAASDPLPLGIDPLSRVAADKNISETAAVVMATLAAHDALYHLSDAQHELAISALHAKRAEK